MSFCFSLSSLEPLVPPPLPCQVVDEHVVQAKPETKNKNTHIVKADWFWYTIQAGYANECDYLFADVSVVTIVTDVLDLFCPFYRVSAH